MPNRRIEIKPHRIGYTVVLYEEHDGGIWEGREHIRPTLNQAFGIAIAFMEGDCDIMGV